MVVDETSLSARLIESPGLRFVGWALLALAFLSAALENPYSLGNAKDWAFYYHHAHSSFLSITEFGQFPAWDPWLCGGISAVGNLQNQAVSPLMLLMVLFGVAPGWKIGMLLYFVLGLEGCYQFGRSLGIRGIGAVTAAVLFCFSGRFAQLFVDGQPVFLGFLWSPWVLFALEKSRHDMRWAVFGGAVMAWIFCDGGVITTPMISVMLGTVTLAYTVWALVDPSRSHWSRPLLALGLMTVVMAGLSAVRLLPVAENVLTLPRTWQGKESYPILHALGMLFLPVKLKSYAAIGTSYVGGATALLFLLALVFRDKLAALLLVLSVVFVGLSTGDGGMLGLWDLHRNLPVVGNLRNPFRYTIFVALFVALGAGRALALVEHHLLRLFDSWKRKLPQRLPYQKTTLSLLIVGLVFAAVGMLAWRSAAPVFRHNRQRVARVFVNPLPRPARQPFRQSLGNPFDTHVWSLVGLGSIACYQDQPFPTSALLRADLKQEEYIKTPENGTIRRISWSPHRIVLDLQLSVDETLYINQNFHRGWGSNKGRVVNKQGLLAVELPAGRHRLTLSFSDPLIWTGLAISIATLLGLLLFFGLPLWRSLVLRRRRERSEAQGGDPAAGSDVV